MRASTPSRMRSPVCGSRRTSPDAPVKRAARMLCSSCVLSTAPPGARPALALPSAAAHTASYMNAALRTAATCCGPKTGEMREWFRRDSGSACIAACSRSKSDCAGKSPWTEIHPDISRCTSAAVVPCMPADA
eukprot:188820-Rhodomonas_salina.1